MCKGSELDTTPGSFARTILSADALAPRFRGGNQDDNAVLADSASSSLGIGGWENYEPDHIVSQQPLKDTNHGGRRVDHMFTCKLDNSFSQERAFVCQYPEPDSSGPPRISQAHTQMAVWAFCDAVGIDVPRHQWLSDERQVVVEEVGRNDEKTWTTLRLDRGQQCVEEINPDRLRDIFSVQLLAGVEDLSHRNLNIGESGRAYVFDFDKADQVFESTAVLSHACNKACKTIRMLNEVRTTPLSLNRMSICDRVKEIASRINNSPHKQRILSTVEEYDRAFANETDRSFVDQFSNNITTLSESG